MFFAHRIAPSIHIVPCGIFTGVALYFMGFYTVKPTARYDKLVGDFLESNRVPVRIYAPLHTEVIAVHYHLVESHAFGCENMQGINHGLKLRFVCVIDRLLEPAMMQESLTVEHDPYTITSDV